MTITLNPSETPEIEDFCHESDEMSDKESLNTEDLTIEVPEDKPIIIEPQPGTSRTIENISNERNPRRIGKFVIGIILAFVSGIIFTGNNWSD